MPAANKKGMAKRYLVSRVTFGGDPNEFRLASFEDTFAALDGDSPVLRGIGQGVHQARAAERRYRPQFAADRLAPDGEPELPPDLVGTTTVERAAEKGPHLFRGAAGRSEQPFSGEAVNQQEAAEFSPRPSLDAPIGSSAAVAAPGATAHPPRIGVTPT